MNTHLESLIQFFSNKLLPLTFSFLDDILLFLFSKLGVSIPGLQWLCSVLMICSLAYWVICLYKYFHAKSCRSHLS